LPGSVSAIIGAAIAGCIVTTAVHADGPEFHLQAWPLLQSINLGDKALIHIDLVNTGTATVRRWVERAPPDHGEYNLNIHIHDADGHAPLLTEDAEKFFHPERFQRPIFTSFMHKDFAPQQAAPETIRLDSLYVLHKGHTYIVSFTEKPQRLVFKGQVFSGRVDSNWVTVSVK
jgi:hypothetical protein